MGQWGVRVEWSCQCCGRQEMLRPFEAAKRKTCSRACASRLANGTPVKQCPNCGVEFSARLSGGQRMEHCSRSCSESARTKATEAKQAGAKIKSSLWRITAINARDFRPTMVSTSCDQCGVAMIVPRLVGEKRSACHACAAVAAKATRRKHKAKRRALTKGASAQLIDPIAVFRRDKWRCHICGCKTPEMKRGTYDDDAPELDHIITLAEGGSHTWGNVACSCRKCNGMKGARSLGQIGLPFAA